MSQVSALEEEDGNIDDGSIIWSQLPSPDLRGSSQPSIHPSLRIITISMKAYYSWIDIDYRTYRRGLFYFPTVTVIITSSSHNITTVLLRPSYQSSNHMGCSSLWSSSPHGPLAHCTATIYYIIYLRWKTSTTSSCRDTLSLTFFNEWISNTGNHY